MTDPQPVIVITKGDGYFRVQFRNSALSPIDFNRPRTFVEHGGATDTAKLLGTATGWPVIDETRKGGGNVPAW